MYLENFHFLFSVLLYLGKQIVYTVIDVHFAYFNFFFYYTRIDIKSFDIYNIILLHKNNFVIEIITF